MKSMDESKLGEEKLDSVTGGNDEPGDKMRGFTSKVPCTNCGGKEFRIDRETSTCVCKGCGQTVKF